VKSRLLTALAALAVLGGVLVAIDRISGGGSGGEATCADIVIWNHRRYSGSSVHRKLRLAGRLPGAARIPSCRDTPDGDPSPAKTVVACRIAGVSPSRAIALRGQPTTKFLFERKAAGD
jgi:Family of unknown function (DUF6281)